MAYVPTLKTQYKEQIKPALMKEFGYTSVMQCPKLTKIVINQGMGQAVADKKLIDVAEAELTQIAGQKAVQTRSRKDLSNFKLRKGMPIGVRKKELRYGKRIDESPRGEACETRQALSAQA